MSSLKALTNAHLSASVADRIKLWKKRRGTKRRRSLKLAANDRQSERLFVAVCFALRQGPSKYA